jgi:hypothetical protein
MMGVLGGDAVGPERIERRREQRSLMFFPVRVEDETRLRDAVCCDVSGSGMQLAMAETVERGTRVVLSFEAPGSQGRRIVSGRVVRSGANEGDGSLLWPQTVGVQFDVFDPFLAALGEA